MRARLAVIAPVAFLLLAGCTRSDIASKYPAEMTRFAQTGGKSLPYFVGKDLNPTWGVDPLASEVRGLRPFQLVDQRNRSVSLETLQNKVTVVSFFFSRCHGICPLTMKQLRRVQHAFKNENRLMMLSFTITPDLDTPTELSAYGKREGIQASRWRTLTGDRTSIYTLARESFQADTFSPTENEKKKLTQEDFLHSEHVYLLDAQQKLRGIYLGRMDDSIDDLIRDVKTLLNRKVAR